MTVSLSCFQTLFFFASRFCEMAWEEVELVTLGLDGLMRHVLNSEH